MKAKNHLVSNIILIVLSITLAFFIAIMIFMLKENSFSPSPAKEDSLYFQVQSHDYAYLVRRIKANEVMGYEPTEEEKEYYALADYYEHAFLYKMYEDNGMTDRAEIYKAKMVVDAAGVGFLESEIHYIEEVLGLDQ